MILVLCALLGPPDADVLYDRYCLPCHGEKGDGNGPAAPLSTPRPRDFTAGIYKWRSTESGKPPTDADLARTLRRGAPGTSMPGYQGILDDAQVAALVAKVKSFAPARFAKAAAAIAVPTGLPAGDGRAVYVRLGCGSCHGEDGRGTREGSDLTRTPLRRGESLGEIWLTLRTGLDGTAMPAFPAGDADLWALAGYVDSIRARGDPPPLPAIGEDPTPVGLSLAPQGPPPASLPPAAQALAPAQCGRCHARQLRDWSGSIHARAQGPGVEGQLQAGMTGDCAACHAPLAEQRADAELRAQGITCAACHLRGNVRHGPPRRPDSALLPIPSYPFVVDPAWERSDFCLPCHQLPPSSAVNGRPLLDTYREWLHGPYLPRGVQCQHCHMPEREHTWKGIHDAETVRQGLSLKVETGAAGVRVVATNVGAGHFLPTTTTPAIWIEVGGVRKRIGRQVRWDKGWKEIEDTRIPPGNSVVVEGPRGPVTVTVAPDDYYEGFYRTLLTAKIPDAARRALEDALERANASRYVLYRRDL